MRDIIDDANYKRIAELEREKDEAINQRDDALASLQLLIDSMVMRSFLNGYTAYSVVLSDDEIDTLRKAAGMEDKQ